MEIIEEYRRKLSQELDRLDYGSHPAELYDPIRYLMSLGGKRMRPLLVLLAYGLKKDDVADILVPALATEVFHNFTLMHDDIMDNAPIRRGKPTVHEKWNANIAILSGDTMMVKAYDMLLHVDTRLLLEVLRKFNRCAVDVCEGQQLDMNFESIESVSEKEYLEMIRLKTAVLLGFSLELGGILAGFDEEATDLIREFGINIGIGFQLKDDLLDVYGDKDKFGKQVGGDIVSNKKTYLLINALKEAKGEQQEKLQDWLTREKFENDEKVAAVTAIYEELGIREMTRSQINRYFDKGFAALEKLNISKERKKPLVDFTNYLINREK
ncbi:MAG: polyprenyl synthetase family protein [Cyclobacteriaceae bacterium]